MNLPNFIENKSFIKVKNNMGIDSDFIINYNNKIDFRKLEMKSNNLIYSRDWVFISKKYKKYRNYICEECGLGCCITKYYLHVHHINGNKLNNSWRNLKVLCRKCHREYHK